MHMHMHMCKCMCTIHDYVEGERGQWAIGGSAPFYQVLRGSLALT